MYINSVVLFLILFYAKLVYLCHYEIYNLNGTIELPPYENNFECNWLFNLSNIANQIQYRYLLINFRYFDTEFGHDELFIGETIDDISKYNSKFSRFSGSKLPDPYLISLRGDILTRSIWMQFTSDHSNTGLGFAFDYIFLTNQTFNLPKTKTILIDADIRHPSELKTKNLKHTYPYPFGTISSPNYPQNYSNNIMCRWRLYHRHAFLRLSIKYFDIESHYDTLTVHFGQNFNNRAMIVYEWSGTNIDNRDLFITNDNVYLVFTTDRTLNATGFSLNYEFIEKEILISNLRENRDDIKSNNYPEYLRTNVEYTWIIDMNHSNTIELEFHDIHIDFQSDYLQIQTDNMIYSITTQKSLRFECINRTTISLRTKHSHRNGEYRGIHLTYQKINEVRYEIDEKKASSICGRTYSSANDTIEFSSSVYLSFDCYFFLEIDDGQNLFIQIEYLDWDNRENFLEIGLLHEVDRNRLFHISDAMPGSWFIINESQAWLRFSASQYSLGTSSFRIIYSETIRWSTVTPEADIQALDNDHLFPYRLISSPTYKSYHNLTQKYIWQIYAFDDELIRFDFRLFQSISNYRICFSINSFLETTQICTIDQFPLNFYQIGSCELSIEPEFVSMLVKYDIQIEKLKKIKKTFEINFNDSQLHLSVPFIFESFIEIEWLITMNTGSLAIIFDIENLDQNTHAKLIVPQDANTTKVYSLENMHFRRFSHVLYNPSLTMKIIYRSYSLPTNSSQRLFRINLYKILKMFFHFNDFTYIFSNQTNFKWTIQAENENSIFSANFYSSDPNLVLQTTANVNLSSNSSSIIIPSSNFDIRYQTKLNISNFLLILYEQQQQQQLSLSPVIHSNRTTDILETHAFTQYILNITIKKFNTIDFVILNADKTSVIRLYDFYENNYEYLLLNSSVIKNKRLDSLIGLRFSIRNRLVKLDLQSNSRNPLQIRYKARVDNSNQSYNCLVFDINSLRNQSCSNYFDYKFMSANETKLPHLWSYALRGSVTLIIENTTSENFEKFIYKKLRQSLAKVVRKFCLRTPENCLSSDSDVIRSDHVIIQSYDEHIDTNRLYVALFIKDPYRRTIALTNEQFLTAIKSNQKQIYQDIKHHIYIPATIFHQYTFDSIWFYTLSLLILLVLIVIILIIILILIKKSTQRKYPVKPPEEPIDQILNSSSSNTSESVTTSDSVLLPRSTTKFHYQQSTIRPSYFNSTIESAMRQHFENDDEPIPFIDENLSNTHSRKSSACWSDRTSLSSRLSSLWRLNRDKRRSQHRSMRYTISPTQANDEL